MEKEFAQLPIISLVSFVSVLLIYAFILPKLPGISFSKSPWPLAVLTALLLTTSSVMVFSGGAISALFVGIWIGIGGGGNTFSVLFFAVFTFATFIAGIISYAIILASELLFKTIIIFTSRRSLFLAAVVLVTGQIFICASVFAILASNAPTTKFGFIDRTGKFVIQPRFGDVQNFTHGLAEIRMPGSDFGTFGKPFFINHQGVAAPTPGDLSKFTRRKPRMDMDDSAAIYEFEGEFSAGQCVIKQRNASFLPFSENLAATQPTGQTTWGFVNRLYVLAIPASFIDVRSFNEGLAAVAVYLDENGHITDRPIGTRSWGYIDHTGRWILKPKFVSAQSFAEGLACVSVPAPTAWNPNATRFGYIDKSGNFVIPPTFKSGQSFSEGVAGAAVETR